MRGILKSLAVIALSIYFTQRLIPTIEILNINTFVILTGLIFLASILIDPLTRILFFIPTNFLVFNLAQLSAIFLVLFFATKSLEEFEIRAFEFPGFTGYGMSIQSLSLPPFQVMLIAAILIYFMSSFLRWLAD